MTTNKENAMSTTDAYSNDSNPERSSSDRSASQPSNVGHSERAADVAAWLHERLGELTIHPVFTTSSQRIVRDRNRVERQIPYDAVLLDDVWRVLDELRADLCAPGQNERGAAQ